MTAKLLGHQLITVFLSLGLTISHAIQGVLFRWAAEAVFLAPGSIFILMDTASFGLLGHISTAKYHP